MSNMIVMFSKFKLNLSLKSKQEISRTLQGMILWWSSEII